MLDQPGVAPGLASPPGRRRRRERGKFPWPAVDTGGLRQLPPPGRSRSARSDRRNAEATSIRLCCRVSTTSTRARQACPPSCEDSTWVEGMLSDRAQAATPRSSARTAPNRGARQARSIPTSTKRCFATATWRGDDGRRRATEGLPSTRPRTAAIPWSRSRPARQSNER